MKKQNKNKKVNKATVQWIFSILFILIAINSISKGISFIFFLLFGLLINPKFPQLYFKIFKKNISSITRVIACVVSFLLIGVTSPKTDSHDTTTANLNNTSVTTTTTLKETTQSTKDTSTMTTTTTPTTTTTQTTTHTEPITTVTTITTTQTELQEPTDHNSNSYVDYIYYKAKQDSTTVSQDKALEYITSNIDSIFDNNEVMEKCMYYGNILSICNKDTNNQNEQIGTYTVNTIKYVYRGTESTTNDDTIQNLNRLKSLLGVEVTEAETTIQETEPQTVAEPPQNDNQSVTVYITPTGKKYHYDSKCGNGTYNPIGLEEAIAEGYTPCKKCA